MLKVQVSACGRIVSNHLESAVAGVTGAINGMLRWTIAGLGCRLASSGERLVS